MSASAGLSALSSMLGLAKRKDVGKQEAIEGQVRVTTAKKDGPDFGDLKLAQCLQVRTLFCCRDDPEIRPLSFELTDGIVTLVAPTVAPPIRRTTAPSGR